MPDPEWPPREVPAARDAPMRAGSKSFALASRLFDPATRDLVWDLYAWCRHCDDVVDGQTAGRGQASVTGGDAGLAALRAGTDAAFAGAPAPAPFVALARVVAATGLPRRLAHDHLAGFAMDVAGRRYETLDDTLDYCYHVAGAVGLMMAWVMGVRERAVLARASDLGIAFQLSNIARDVGDDAAAGRIYLPSSWLRQGGIALTGGRVPERATAETLSPVVARLVAEAERYYDSAWYGVADLPVRSAWAVATARLVYRDIGRAVVRRGAEAWTTRTIVGAPVKVARLLQAGVATGWTKALTGAAPPRIGLYTPASLDVLRWKR